MYSQLGLKKGRAIVQTFTQDETNVQIQALAFSIVNVGDVPCETSLGSTTLESGESWPFGPVQGCYYEQDFSLQFSNIGTGAKKVLVTQFIITDTAETCN